MADETVLVIDDEPQIRRVVRNALKDEGDVARTIEAGTGAEGIDLAAAERPALIVLDLGLPDMAGEAVCREIRSWSTAPIIILSARHSEKEKVALLNAGADDYITKPFSTVEFQARVRAQLRRARLAGAGDTGEPLTLGNGVVTIDVRKPQLLKNGASVHLTRTEWELLRVMVAHAGRTLTHRELFTAVWGNSFGDAQQYLRVHIRSLRRKMEPDPVRPRFIVTEPGVGYRLEPAV